MLVAGLGDSIAAGEGNPDRPVRLSDEGFCFRRFLGLETSEYYRPGRAGYSGNRSCVTEGDGPACRCLGAPKRALALRALPPLAVRLPDARRARSRDRESAHRRHLHSARLLGRDDCDRLPRLAAHHRMSEPRHQHRLLVDVARADHGADRSAGVGAQASRRPQASTWCCSPSAPTTSSSPGWWPTSSSRHAPNGCLFGRSGHIATVPDSQKILDRNLPNDFLKLRAALKPSGRRRSFARRVRLLRPSGAGRARACLPRRAQRLRRPSGVRRRSAAAAAGRSSSSPTSSCRRSKRSPRATASSAAIPRPTG